MIGLIYNYLKEKLEFATNDPNEYRRLIIEAERDLNRIKKEHDNTWRYCLGCRGYVKRAEAYEDEYKGHVVFRCCNCDAIIEFPDLGVY